MILEFETFIARHGEVVAQAILENIERFEGIRSSTATSLEERWFAVIQTGTEQRLAA
jgi:hypothetical protein